MEENKEHIIAKWLEGSISDESLNHQYDAKMSGDLKMIKDVADQLEVPEIDSQALLGKIKRDLNIQSDTKNIRSLRYWMSGIAALLIAVLAYTALLDDVIRVENDTLSHVSHTLPDGSIIRLNANTQIQYDADFKSNRKLNLSGEAFFEVKKGATFVVQTDNGTVTVLGTSFNVFSRNNHFNVACKTGRVRVDTERDYILNPGETVVSTKNVTTVQGKVKIEQIGAWINGESIFSSSPMDEVILALEAQYNVKVKGQLSDGNEKFTGSFVHDDIDKALRMVFLPMGISYELDQKKTSITIQ